jgi:hypothetical protein
VASGSRAPWVLPGGLRSPHCIRPMQRWVTGPDRRRGGWADGEVGATPTERNQHAAMV